MAAKRVHEFADELGMSSVAMMQMLRGMDVAVKDYMSIVDDNVQSQIRERIMAKRTQINEGRLKREEAKRESSPDLNSQKNRPTLPNAHYDPNKFLLLNFVEYGSFRSVYGNNRDFYNRSLEEQYDILAARYSLRSTFQKLMQICFPTGMEQDYYISMPNFIRDEEISAKAQYYNNIVIRAARNSASNQVLPAGLEMMLIGDVSNRFGEFRVKGIELIDGAVTETCETRIYTEAKCSFSTYRNNTFPNYGIRLDENISILNRDFMLEICQHNYTVDPVNALDIYNKWDEYIKFRYYYLDEKGKDSIPFDDCNAMECYNISRRDYQLEPEKYDQYILDDYNDIRKANDEYVIVTKQFDDDGDPLTLIRVTIDKNKKELFGETDKNKGSLPIFEQWLRRFTHSDLVLGNNDKGRVNIGERYRFYYRDIEPDYSYVEAEAERILQKKFREIDVLYAAAQKQRVNEYVDKRKAEQTAADEATLEDYKKTLANNLLTEVKENKDSEIRKKYKELLKAAKSAEKKSEKKADVSLQKLYENRNSQWLTDKANELKRARDVKLVREQEEKQREIKEELEPQIQSEKENAKSVADETLATQKESMKKNDTIRRYYIYFKTQTDENAEKINGDIAKVKPCYLKFDQRREKAKIDRQKKALDNFFGGYVKNPFLSSYLLAPRELSKDGRTLANEDVEFYSQRLNDMQQEAVRKAIASESIFLLQGPPGTGKTEVIAEITAQFIKRGKRVLISSETHKAIENVFERLPKIPEIRPLRMTPPKSKKESPYSPERLVDNFYTNIRDRIDKEVERFEHFNETKEMFSEMFDGLRLTQDRLEREKERIQNAERLLDSMKLNKQSLLEKHDLENEALRTLDEENDALVLNLRKIERFELTDDDNPINADCEKLLAKYKFLVQKSQTLATIHNTDIQILKDEIASLSDNSGNSELVELKKKQEKLRSRMTALCDPDTDEVLPGNEVEHKELQKQLIDLGKNIKSAKSNSNVDPSNLTITKLVGIKNLQPEILDSVVKHILEIKKSLIDIIANARTEYGKRIDVKKAEIYERKNNIADLDKKIWEKDKEEQSIKENADYENHKFLESRLKSEISKFFQKFGINTPYDSIGQALDIIKKEWELLERDYKQRKKEADEKIPLYKDISKFLYGLDTNNEIENDREKYTKKLFDKANVFGLTCTSRENFKAESVDAFEQYGIEGLNVREQGIDVVIVDEVSKSSFLDLLIPILYGKTVILVGDHRQLPPSYDLGKIKAEEFEGLDQNIITPSINQKYKELYEESFFKKLFYEVPERLRVRLNKQYRCHEHIMKVFNHFYGDVSGRGTLEIGTPNQNDNKQHGLLIKNGRGKPIIESNKHIYFIDCGDGYEHWGDSRSAINELEAKVIAELAKKIDTACGRLPPSRVEKSRGIDERKSMGIICPYREQVKLIKQRLKRHKLKNICERYEERYIVSTVDDFQGDERDIILVSMVRNPKPKNKKQWLGDFIKQFERINVAFSRARRLLVIVGAKDCLSELSVDLPDMDGNKVLDRKACKVYKDIIETVSLYGSVLKASDILEGAK